MNAFAKIMKRFVPIAANAAQALLDREADTCVAGNMGHLRLTSDFHHADGHQRVTLHHVQPNAEPVALATAVSNEDPLRAVLGGYVHAAKVVAAELYVLTEQRQSALVTAVDDLSNGGYAHLRLGTDFLPAGSVLRLWAVPREDLDGDPVQLITCGKHDLLSPIVPTPEQKKRAAWLLNALPVAH